MKNSVIFVEGEDNNNVFVVVVVVVDVVARVVFRQ
jgi:hypothetical protein